MLCLGLNAIPARDCLEEHTCYFLTVTERVSLINPGDGYSCNPNVCFEAHPAI